MRIGKGEERAKERFGCAHGGDHAARAMRTGSSLLSCLLAVSLLLLFGGDRARLLPGGSIGDYTITGRVTDRQGRPVPVVHIRGAMAEAWTGVDGKFRFGPLRRDYLEDRPNIWLKLSRYGYEPVSTLLRNALAAGEVALTMQKRSKSGSITVSLRGPEARHLDRIAYSPYLRSDPGYQVLYPAPVDEHGRARIPVFAGIRQIRMESGRHDLVFECDDHDIDWQPSDAHEIAVTVIRNPDVTVEVRAVDGSGKPRTHFDAFVLPDWGAMTGLDRDRAVALYMFLGAPRCGLPVFHGALVFPGAAAGKYVVCAFSPHGICEPVRVVATEGSTVTATVRFRKGRAVHVKIVRAVGGQAVSDAMILRGRWSLDACGRFLGLVSLFHSFLDEKAAPRTALEQKLAEMRLAVAHEGACMTDAHGSGVVIMGDDRNVTIYKPGYGLCTEPLPPEGADGETTLRIPGGPVIVGRVKGLPATAKGKGFVRVSENVLAGTGARGLLVGHGLLFPVGEDGAFRVAHLPAGSYCVSYVGAPATQRTIRMASTCVEVGGRVARVVISAR